MKNNLLVGLLLLSGTVCASEPTKVRVGTLVITHLDNQDPFKFQFHTNKDGRRLSALELKKLIEGSNKTETII